MQTKTGQRPQGKGQRTNRILAVIQLQPSNSMSLRKPKSFAACSTTFTLLVHFCQIILNANQEVFFLSFSLSPADHSGINQPYFKMPLLFATVPEFGLAWRCHRGDISAFLGHPSVALVEIRNPEPPGLPARSLVDRATLQDIFWGEMQGQREIPSCLSRGSQMASDTLARAKSAFFYSAKFVAVRFAQDVLRPMT